MPGGFARAEFAAGGANMAARGVSVAAVMKNILGKSTKK
jgi:hypothetical protein